MAASVSGAAARPRLRSRYVVLGLSWYQYVADAAMCIESTDRSVASSVTQVHVVEDHGDVLEHLYDAIGVSCGTGGQHGGGVVAL